MNFSEREKGLPVRDQEILSDRAWHGLISLVDNLIDNNNFGKSFPYICGNCGGNAGSDNNRLNSTLYAEIGIENSWAYFKSYCLDDDSRKSYCLDKKITDKELCWIALDLIEFCFEYCATPTPEKSLSGCWGHGGVQYRRYDADSFKSEWREKINYFFSKHGLAYDFNESGKIIRLLDSTFKKDFSSLIQTGDDDLDKLLIRSKENYLNPKTENRKSSIKLLWDAWGRVKTLDAANRKEKRSSIENIIRKISENNDGLFDFLNQEATALTKFGDGEYGGYALRHTESYHQFINDENLIDYLFQRLFCLIILILKSKGYINQ
ncbi:AbiJ-NTD4 domain-containing protein [Thiothrix unzii]|uniref:AbiJ-NTD4 domain-containing protein n=1 Tax=Thiothrix unzii TaxID=111769 RepID=UPI002A363814|nr:hypothetical protein [Thiothrix unzii]MDX9987830.1 hypothetical protein [Thiothrix unzii]